MFLLYVKALGTPFPVGTRIIDSVTGKRHKISGYRYTERDGLLIQTEDGAELPDYDKVAAPLRCYPNRAILPTAYREGINEEGLYNNTHRGNAGV